MVARLRGTKAMELANKLPFSSLRALTCRYLLLMAAGPPLTWATKVGSALVIVVVVVMVWVVS